MPPRLTGEASERQLALELLGMGLRPNAVPDADWPPFDEPPLLGLEMARRAVIIARLAAVAWGIAIFAFGLRVRATIEDGNTGAIASIDRVGYLGLIAVSFAACTGWLWSDRATQNVRRMGGRLPTRRRCVSAWALPLAWAAALWLTGLHIDKTEGFDLRPAIVATCTAFVIWRPYSLVRRILATLSRVRSDALIGTVYLLDVAAFGLLWWQVASWPSIETTVTAADVDVLLGVSAAATVCLALNVGSWIWLTHNVAAAENDRMLALRTRHDHRQLRLRGIDPMDPDIRRALLRSRGDRLEHVEAQRERVAARSKRHIEVAFAAKNKPTPADADRSSISVESSPEAATLVGEIVNSAAGTQIIADLVSQIASAETEAHKAIAHLVQEVAEETNSRATGTPIGLFAAALADLPTRDAPLAESNPEAVNAFDEARPNPSLGPTRSPRMRR